MLERTTGLVVGGIGFFGPPRAGATEIGYGIVASGRGRGCATEAIRCMLELASGHPDVAVVTATVDPSNTASVRVLEKAGFTRVAVEGTEVRHSVDVQAGRLTASDSSPPTG